MRQSSLVLRKRLDRCEVAGQAKYNISAADIPNVCPILLMGSPFNPFTAVGIA